MFHGALAQLEGVISCIEVRCAHPERGRTIEGQLFMAKETQKCIEIVLVKVDRDEFMSSTLMKQNRSTFNDTYVIAAFWVLAKNVTMI